MFKSLYTQPEKVPTPPPTPPPVSPKQPAKPRTPASKKKPKERPQPKPVIKQVTSRKPPLRRPFDVATSTRRRARLRLKVNASRYDTPDDAIENTNQIEMSGVDSKPSESSEKPPEDVDHPIETTEIEPKPAEDNPIVNTMDKLLGSPDTLLKASTESSKPSEGSVHEISDSGTDESANEEDDIIDIGDPPTPPPMESLPSVPSTPTAATANPFLTPSKPGLLREESFTSSPSKYFSICSETVVEQSEQMDQSGEQNHSHTSHESFISTHVSGERDLISEAEDESPNHNLSQISSQEDQTELSQQSTADETRTPSDDDDQAFCDQDTESEEESQLFEDKEQCSEEVEELDNSDEVTECGESDGVEVDSVAGDASNDSEKKVIAPLRISKRQVGKLCELYINMFLSYIGAYNAALFWSYFSMSTHNFSWRITTGMSQREGE